MYNNSLYLVAGLGNPGEKYRLTRHNAGFMVIEQLADHFSIALNNIKDDIHYGIGRLEGLSVILAKPMSFMNLSGIPLSRVAKFYKISGKNMLIVHDDIDLTFGSIKIKEKGGHGGHRGLRSIMDSFGEGDFARLRIGIGRPYGEIQVSDHVLAKFSADECLAIEQITKAAQEAVVTILCKGTKEGMNRFNRKQLINKLDRTNGGKNGSFR